MKAIPAKSKAIEFVNSWFFMSTEKDDKLTSYLWCPGLLFISRREFAVGN